MLSFSSTLRGRTRREREKEKEREHRPAGECLLSSPRTGTNPIILVNREDWGLLVRGSAFSLFLSYFSSRLSSKSDSAVRVCVCVCVCVCVLMVWFVWCVCCLCWTVCFSIRRGWMRRKQEKGKYTILSSSPHLVSILPPRRKTGMSTFVSYPDTRHNNIMFNNTRNNKQPMLSNDDDDKPKSTPGTGTTGWLRRSTTTNNPEWHSSVTGVTCCSSKSSSRTRTMVTSCDVKNAAVGGPHDQKRKKNDKRSNVWWRRHSFTFSSSVVYSSPSTTHRTTNCRLFNAVGTRGRVCVLCTVITLTSLCCCLPKSTWTRVREQEAKPARLPS